jgi:predicted nucleic acid-binding protein
VAGILIETDVFVEFLMAPAGEAPALRNLLAEHSCFMTFIQASELFSAANSDEERSEIERSLSGIKVLGASSRYSKTIGRLLTSLAGTPDAHRTAIVAAIALESNLPVVTSTRKSEFDAIPDLMVFAPSSVPPGT